MLSVICECDCLLKSASCYCEISLSFWARPIGWLAGWSVCVCVCVCVMYKFLSEYTCVYLCGCVQWCVTSSTATDWSSEAHCDSTADCQSSTSRWPSCRSQSISHEWAELSDGSSCWVDLRPQPTWCEYGTPRPLLTQSTHSLTHCRIISFNWLPEKAALVFRTLLVWDWKCSRISPLRFLAECHRRWLNWGFFLLLCFELFDV